MPNTLGRSSGGVDGLGLSVTIAAVDDPHLLAVDIQASSERYRGSAVVWLDRCTLTGFADALEGFPARPGDERVVTLGHRDSKTLDGFRFVRGLCVLRFRYGNGTLGGTMVEAYFEDDASPATAAFTFATEAAYVDRFVSSLRHLAGPNGGNIGQVALLGGSA